MKTLAALALAASLLVTPAFSADFKFVNDTGGDSIIIEGNIYKGDDARFKSFLAKHPQVDLIGLSASFGGDWNAATSIGRTISARGLYTIALNDICNSACASIWIAGAEMYVMPGNTSPLFHMPYDNATGKERPELMAKYASQIGLPAAFTSYFVAQARGTNTAVVDKISTGGGSSNLFSISLAKLKSWGLKAYVLR